MKKKILITTLTFLFIILGVHITHNKLTHAEPIAEDVYDVILFWGQSNMVGTTDYLDERYGSEEADEISKLTGMDLDIVKNSPKMNVTKVTPEPGTIYEYKLMADNDNEVTFEEIFGNAIDGNVYGNCIGIENGRYYIKDECSTIGKAGKLEEIYSNESHYTFGENLSMNKQPNANFTEITTFTPNEPNKPMATLQSNGVNAVPEFCKTYYEKTGRKVIAIVAAMGGQRIRAFLPNALSNGAIAASENVANIYETIHAKYTAATNYLAREGLLTTDSRSYYVVIQGESDVYDAAYALSAGAYTNQQLKTMYVNNYKEVHNNLKNQLGIPKGIIIETSGASGLDYENIYEGVEIIHQAQEELAEKNDDIIIGSRYLYERYVPTKEIYNSTAFTKNKYYNGLSYEDALISARYNAGINTKDEPEYQPLLGSEYNNTIHFNSSTLSHVGREAAHTLTNELILNITIDKNIKTKYIHNYEELDMNSNIYITYTDNKTRTLPMTNANVTITGFDNTKLGKQTITVSYGNKTTNFEIEIIKKDITSISIKTKPTKLTYIQNYEKLNLTDGLLTVTYNDQSIEEIPMTNANVTITGFDNTKLGKQTITVSYGNKTTNFEIEIIANNLGFDDSLDIVENKFIYMPQAQTTIEEIYNMINTNGNVSIYDHNNNLITDSTNKVSTGYKIKLEFTNDTVTYTVVVRGDVTGNGIIDKHDVQKISKHILTGNVLTSEEYIKAADIDGNNFIDINDIIKLTLNVINNF